MRRDPDGRFGHVALAAEALFLCVSWTSYEEEDLQRRRRRPWLFMVATWSKSRSYRRNGQIGREGENERERERERGREWGTLWEGGEEERRSVAWKVAACSRTFARETRRSAANFHSLKFALSGVGGGK